MHLHDEHCWTPPSEGGAITTPITCPYRPDGGPLDAAPTLLHASEIVRAAMVYHRPCASRAHPTTPRFLALIRQIERIAQELLLAHAPGTYPDDSAAPDEEDAPEPRSLAPGDVAARDSF